MVQNTPQDFSHSRESYRRIVHFGRQKMSIKRASSKGYYIVLDNDTLFDAMSKDPLLVHRVHYVTQKYARTPSDLGYSWGPFKMWTEAHLDLLRTIDECCRGSYANDVYAVFSIVIR